MAEVTWNSNFGKPEIWAAFSKKNMLSIWALPVCGRGLKVCPNGLGQTFLQSKFLTFGVPKCLPGWFVAKRVPKCWEPRKMRLQLGEMVQIFSTALFSHSWDCSARLVYQSSAKGWKILSTRKLQVNFYQALHTSTTQARRYFQFWKMIFSQDQENSSFEGLSNWHWEVQLLRHWTSILGD